MRKERRSMKGRRKLSRLTSWIMTAAMVMSLLIVTSYSGTVEAASTTTENVYITDLSAVYSDNGDGVAAAQKKLTDAGYTVINKDLNEKAGGAYIFLGYKTSNDPSEAITNITSKDSSSSSYVVDEGYEVVTWYGETDGADMNRGAGGDFIYLFYTKDVDRGAPVSSITFNDSSTDAWTCDLNKSRSGSSDIFMHGTRNVAFEDNTKDVAYDGSNYSIDVSSRTSVMPVQVTITYSDTATGDYSTIKPTFSATGDHTVFWKMNADGYNETTGFTTFTISDSTYSTGVVIDAFFRLRAVGADPVEGEDYSYSSAEGLKILSDRAMVLETVNTGGTAIFKNAIEICNSSAKLTMRNITVLRNTDGAGLLVNTDSGDMATVIFEGENTFVAKSAYAGIQKNGDGTLVLKGGVGTNNKITARGGSSSTYGAAGIGQGNGNSNGSDIEISDLEVMAYGSAPTSKADNGAAGIGSRYNTPVYGITLNNCSGYAYGANNAAAIGSGANATASAIEIYGGSIRAIAAGGGAGIGCGAEFDNTKGVFASNITIKGNVLCNGGSDGGAGIGSGKGADVYVITIDSVTGGISAVGGNGAAGIGSGDGGNVSSISIDSSIIDKALGGENAAGIGGGNGGEVEDIYISGDTSITQVKGGAYGAAIGSGSFGSVQGIVIDTSGSSHIVAGDSAAAIGAGAFNHSASNISIILTGNGMMDIDGIIGAGNGCDVSDIYVNSYGDAIVKADGIGSISGSVSDVEVFSEGIVNLVNGIVADLQSYADNIVMLGPNLLPNITDNPPVPANATNYVVIKDTDDENAYYAISGNVSITRDTTITTSMLQFILDDDVCLTIPDGVTLTVEQKNDSSDALVWAENSNAELVVDGTLIVEGNMSMLSENGTILINSTGEVYLKNDVPCDGDVIIRGTVHGPGRFLNEDEEEIEEDDESVVINLVMDSDGVGFETELKVVGNSVVVEEDDISPVDGKAEIATFFANEGYTITDICIGEESVIDTDAVIKDGDNYTLKPSLTGLLGQELYVYIDSVPDVEAIEVVSPPAKTLYAKGDTFRDDGLIVAIVYKDDTRDFVDTSDERIKVTGFDNQQIGTQLLTVEYDDGVKQLTDTFNVTVYDFGGVSDDPSKTFFTYEKDGEEQSIGADFIENDYIHLVIFNLTDVGNIGNISEMGDNITLGPVGPYCVAGDAMLDSVEYQGDQEVVASFSVPITDTKSGFEIYYTVMIVQNFTPIDLSANNITVDVEDAVFAEGEEVEPEFVVNYYDESRGETHEIENYQFISEFADNIEATDAENKARLILTGDGIYTIGRKVVEFDIQKADFTGEFSKSEDVDLTDEVQFMYDIPFEIPSEYLYNKDVTITYDLVSGDDIVEIDNGMVTSIPGVSGKAQVDMIVNIKDTAKNYNSCEKVYTFNFNVEATVPAETITILKDGEELEKSEDGNYMLPMTIGEEVDLEAVLDEGATSLIYWETEDDNISVINGSVSADEVGYAIIEVKSGNAVVYIDVAVSECEHDMTHIIGKEPTCEDAGNIDCWYCYKCNRYFLDEYGIEEVDEDDVWLEPLGHDWGGPSYVWSDDYSTVDASIKCNRCEETIEESVGTTYTDGVAPTCTKAGSRIYLATFTSEHFEDQETEVYNVPPKGHDIKNIEYTWAENGSFCIATAECATCGAQFFEKGDITSEVIKEATCDTDGIKRFTATFISDFFEERTKDIVIPATGHDWGGASYVWDDDYKGCTASISCNNCELVIEEYAVSEATVVTEATCTTPGTHLYEVTFESDMFEDQEAEVDDIPATGHNFEYSYEWKEENGGWGCTGTAVCANCGLTYEEEATVESAGSDPTCEKDGIVDYTATFTKEGFEEQVKTVVTPATGHRYVDIKYRWASDGSECVATARCEVCDNQVYEDATITSEVTKEPTKTEMGETTYTATFENEIFDTQEKTIADIDKLPDEGGGDEGGGGDQGGGDQGGGDQGGGGQGGGDQGGGDQGGGGQKTSYSDEWVDGKYYNADGTVSDRTLSWKQDAKGWWIEDNKGWYPTNQWQKIDGKWYYFLADGYMDYSEYRDGCWLGADGAWDEAYSGGHWMSDANGWWYEDASGWYPVNQWLWIDGSCYYFYASGYMAANTYIDNYYVNASGAWVK